MSVDVEHPSLGANYGVGSNRGATKRAQSADSKAVSKLLKEIAINQPENEINWVQGFINKVDKPFIQEYITNTTGSTHGMGLTVLETFEINRPEDAIDFRQDMSNRRLLFHGTSKQNLFSIIRNGFDMKRANPGCMFGKGMYFSDCATKAFNYVRDFVPNYGMRLSSTKNHSYILLCEIALGKIKVCKFADHSAHSKLGDADSVIGEGSHVSTTAKYDEDGLMICAGKLEVKRGASLAYNEYIVYNSNQIRLKYLVKVKQGNPSHNVTNNLNTSINNGNFYPFNMVPNPYFPPFTTAPTNTSFFPPNYVAPVIGSGLYSTQQIYPAPLLTNNGQKSRIPLQPIYNPNPLPSYTGPTNNVVNQLTPPTLPAKKRKANNVVAPSIQPIPAQQISVSSVSLTRKIKKAKKSIKATSSTNLNVPNIDPIDAPSTSSAVPLKKPKVEPVDAPSSNSVICSKCKNSPFNGLLSSSNQTNNCDKCIDALINAYLGPLFANQAPQSSIQTSQQNSVQQLETFPSIYCPYYTAFALPTQGSVPSTPPQDLPQMLCNYCSAWHA